MAPSTVPTFFIAGCIVPAADLDDGYGYTVSDVTLAGGLIASVAPAGSAAPPAGATLVNGSDKLLLPGTVNAHTHTSEHWARGLIKPLPLELWIHQLVRHEPRGVEGGKLLGYDDPFTQCPPELVGLSCLHAGVETLLGGATALMDHLWVRHIEDVRCAVEAYRALGVRVWLALMLGDTEGDNYANYTACCANAEERNAAAAAAGCACGGMGEGGIFRVKPNGYDQAKTDAAVALWEEAIALFHRPEEGINIAIGPVTCFSASRQLIRRGAELRKKHGLAGHIHLLETQGQCLQSRQYFGPGGCVAMLAEEGFLQLPGTSLAHCVWLDDADVAAIVAAGATVVHNPASNLRLGSGVAPVRRYLDAGVNVALGADGACSSDAQDMCEAMKLACLLSTLGDREYRRWMEPKEAFAMASEGGYRGLGMEGKGGLLKPGCVADVCLYDLTCLSMLPLADPLGSLVLGRPSGGPGGDALWGCWVRGVQLVEAGSFKTVDVDRLRQDLRAVYPCIRRRAATDPRANEYTAAVEREFRAAVGLEGTIRGEAAHVKAAHSLLADNYPPGRTLDERTSFP